MHWLAILFFGLLTGLIGAVYGGLVADKATTWLRISSFEGGSGYFVVFMILLAFVGSLILGLVICTMVGGPGWSGILRGFGSAGGTVLVVITIAGALAWAQADREPLVAGQPIDLAVEVRLPPGSAKPEPDDTLQNYVALYSGSRRKTHLNQLRVEDARLEDGRWIVPTQIQIHVSEAPRMLGVKRPGHETQFFDTPIPATPKALDDRWSPWLDAPYLGSLAKPPAEQALAIRYRVVRRPAPPPEPPREPTFEERQQTTYKGLSPDAPTEEWLALTTLDTPENIRAAAIKTVAQRPDFAAALTARIRSEDQATARDAMYLVGALEPPPAEVGEAVREQARRVVAIAKSIDPAAEDSRDQLYERAHMLVTGVMAAAFGLRRAGVDIRPELAAMAAAARDPEKPGGDIVGGCERIIAHFAKLDREAGR
jgi:hypothetical protein